ncbi:hypothetical protein Tco_0755919 [Tanacetum coccineum]
MHVLDQNIKEDVKDVGFIAMEEVTFEDQDNQVLSSWYYLWFTVHSSDSSYDQEDQEEIDITPKDAEEGDAFESLSGLTSMPDDDLASMTGFETQDSADHVSEECTETLHAFADKPAQSDPLGHLYEELCLLHNKVNQLESSITKHVSNFIQAIVPVIVTNTLKEQLPGLLSDALKDTLPQLIKDTIKREQPSAQVVPNAGQAPFVNEEKALVLHTLEEKSSKEDTLGKKETDDEPPAKKLKFLVPSSSIPSPTPLKSIMPEPPKVTKASKMTLDQFTKHLNKTTSSIFSPTPLRELNLLKEPTPPRDSAKGKEVAIIEEQVNKLVSYQEEGGSNPKMPKITSFTTSVGPLSQEEFNAQIKEMKRLADLKAKKEKSEQEIRKMFNQATLKAQAQKWTEHEAKKVKMMEEYNHLISFKADKLPIIKISYVVNPNKEATMKITKGDNPLNLIVHPKFRIKTMGFIEWLEAIKLGLPPPPALATFRMTAEDKKRKRTKILEQVFVKENVVVDGMHRNLIPPLEIEGKKGLVIREPKSWIFYYNGN